MDEKSRTQSRRVALVVATYIAVACGTGKSARNDGEASPASPSEPAASPIPPLAVSPSSGADDPTVSLDETVCRFVWPSNEMSGCDESEWCIPLIDSTTTCVTIGTGEAANPCRTFGDCAEGLLCSSELTCTPLCNDDVPCPQGSACRYLYDAGGDALYRHCAPVSDVPCCLNTDTACTCYDQCPHDQLDPSCDATDGCCYRGWEDDGIATCVCFSEFSSDYANCTEFVQRQGTAQGLALTEVPSCP